jgi:hypothetical protein
MRSGVRSPQRPFGAPVDRKCQRVFSFDQLSACGNDFARLDSLFMTVHLVSSCQSRHFVVRSWCKLSRRHRRASLQCFVHLDISSGRLGGILFRNGVEGERRQHVERPLHVQELRVGVRLHRHTDIGLSHRSLRGPGCNAPFAQQLAERCPQSVHV